MKKFKFSMQHILNVNRTLKESARMELLKARDLLEEEQRKLRKIEDRIIDAMSIDKIFENSSGLYFLQREKYLKKLKGDRGKQKEQITATEEYVEECMERFTEESIELKKMEKAKEKEKEVWTRDFNREVQKVNDEIATTLAYYNNKKIIGFEE